MLQPQKFAAHLAAFGVLFLCIGLYLDFNRDETPAVTYEEVLVDCSLEFGPVIVTLTVPNTLNTSAFTEDEKSEFDDEICERLLGKLIDKLNEAPSNE